jgi:hypothetical protein
VELQAFGLSVVALLLAAVAFVAAALAEAEERAAIELDAG